MSEAYETFDEAPAPRRSNVSVDTKTSFYMAAKKARQAQDAAKVVYDQAKGEYRNVLKQAKKAGVSAEAITATLAIRGLNPDKVVDEEREKLEMWEITGELRGIGTLLFGGEPFEETPPETERELANDRAYDRGHAAGLNGSVRDENPHHQGSEELVLWDRGWHAGQEAIGMRMQPEPTEDEPPVDAPPVRRRGNGSVMPPAPPLPAF